MLSQTPPAAVPRPLDWSHTRLLWASLPALAILLAGAAVIVLSGNNPPFQGLDNAWYRVMVESRTPWLTSANLVLDVVGNAGMVLYVAVLFVVLMIYNRRLAVFTVSANVGALALTHVVKWVVGRPRPEGPLVLVNSDAYPSGHVSATVAAMLTTAVVLGKLWIWVSGAIVSAAMMYSRTYLGAHWASDTIAGLLLGVGVTLLVCLALKNKSPNRHIRKN